ncbi:MAG: hypothetical protein AB1325_02910 [Nitrospirota bacterium]
MKKTFLSTLIFLFTVTVLTGFVFAEGKKAKAAKSTSASNILYVCNCGPECKCNTVSTKTGKCACGAELVPMHILKIENDEAILCTCGKDCTCKLDPNDPSKCGCGKQVRRVSIKGMYACSCGAGCECNTVSDKPGKCKCGADLKKI